MLLVAGIVTPDAAEPLDVIREAESVLVQALFDDLVHTIHPTQLSTHTAHDHFHVYAPSARTAVLVPGGGREYMVFPWARSPPDTEQSFGLRPSE